MHSFLGINYYEDDFWYQKFIRLKTVTENRNNSLDRCLDDTKPENRLNENYSCNRCMDKEFEQVLSPRNLFTYQHQAKDIQGMMGQDWNDTANSARKSKKKWFHFSLLPLFKHHLYRINGEKNDLCNSASVIERYRPLAETRVTDSRRSTCAVINVPSFNDLNEYGYIDPRYVASIPTPSFHHRLRVTNEEKDNQNIPITENGLSISTLEEDSSNNTDNINYKTEHKYLQSEGRSSSKGTVNKKESYRGADCDQTAATPRRNSGESNHVYMDLIDAQNAADYDNKL